MKKQVNQEDFSVLKQKVEFETFHNCHSEALKMIADFFGYPEYSDFFEEYAEKDEITTDEFKERYEASERMLIIIESEYGSEVAKEISNLL